MLAFRRICKVLVVRGFRKEHFSGSAGAVVLLEGPPAAGGFRLNQQKMQLRPITKNRSPLPVRKKQGWRFISHQHGYQLRLAEGCVPEKTFWIWCLNRFPRRLAPKEMTQNYVTCAGILLHRKTKPSGCDANVMDSHPQNSSSSTATPDHVSGASLPRLAEGCVPEKTFWLWCLNRLPRQLAQKETNRNYVTRAGILLHHKTNPSGSDCGRVMLILNGLELVRFVKLVGECVSSLKGARTISHSLNDPPSW